MTNISPFSHNNNVFLSVFFSKSNRTMTLSTKTLLEFQSIPPVKQEINFQSFPTFNLLFYLLAGVSKFYLTTEVQ